MERGVKGEGMTKLIRHCWILSVLLLSCGTIYPTFADSQVILTLDRDYFNPFAAGVKYDLAFKNVEKNAVWDITCTILDNKTQLVYNTGTFRNMTFGRRKEFYFFVNGNKENAWTTTVCMVGNKNVEQNNTDVNGQLGSHYMNLPLKLTLPTEKTIPVFSVKPTRSQKGPVIIHNGFTHSIFGGDGTREVDWTILLEFHKRAKPEEER